MTHDDKARQAKPIQVKPKSGAVIHAVDERLRRHLRGKWPISLAGAVSEIRLEAPDCDLDDRELADLIAIRAVETGCDVIFDADLLDKASQDEA